MHYFDHNATTPLLPAARAAWLTASDQLVGNPSSPHRLGGRADAALTAAREQLAGFLGCDPLDLVWTSGATESNNMALHHAARTLPARTEIWVSAIEHPCVLDAARHLFDKRLQFIPVTRDGVVDLRWMKGKLKRARPGLVAVMAANNETGVLQPWAEALDICRSAGVPMLCDAAQWLGKLPAQGLGTADFVSGCAHKFGGPKGVGFLKCPARGRIEPLLLGGKQEEGRRAGTENVAGVVAMLAALADREALLAQGAHRVRARWRAGFEKQLAQRLPGVEILGAGQERLWNTVSALMPEADCRQRWVVKLDKAGFAVSTGSACASGREEPSHVLAAMGRTNAEAGRVLRFSSGWETAESDWRALAEGVVAVERGIQRSTSNAQRSTFKD
jgi:cysteine desulfurase